MEQPCGGLPYAYFGLSHSHDDEIVIIYFETEEKDLIQQKMIQIAENMRQKIEKYLKTTVSIGIGFIYDSCRDISLSYRDAKSTFEFRHMIGKNRVLISGDTGLPPSSFAKTKLHGLEKEFAMNVKLGLENKAFSILDEIQQMLLEMKYVTLSQLRLIGVEITLPLFKEFEEWISDSEMLVAESGEVTDFYLFNQNVERYQTNDELFSALRRLTKHFVDIANHQRERQMKSNIHTAMDYMEKNFMVEGLSLLDVAGYVHISPTYLSNCA
ncbi:hypothetical protein [Paenibacillus sp. PAMC21692]|uniref:hypothetical protein n=1 Tax=Paenibacillus sp. PAMC21692 TaxID=2762320 RepID=UPI00164D7444|nr:hypothetical protein [Paenibacillus sp. PAMC21692]QNK58880.1 hypothetical protein H7F31_08445 [Paenibacillus sp. PAMC21692]